MIIETMTIEQVADALYRDEYANWTYAGAYALADYMDTLSAELGEDIKFNRIEWRCDFNEFRSLDEYLEQYPDDAISPLTTPEVWSDVEGLVAVLDNGGAIVHAQ